MKHTIKISILVAVAIMMIATPIFASTQGNSNYYQNRDTSYGFYDPYYSYDDMFANRGQNFYDRQSDVRDRYSDKYNKYYDSYYRNYYNNYYNDYYKNYYKNYYENLYKNTTPSPTPVIRWPEESPVISKWPENEPFDEMFGYPPVKKDSTIDSKQKQNTSRELFSFPTISLTNASDFKIEDNVGTLNFKANKDNPPKEDSFIFTVANAENNNPIKTRAIKNSLKQISDTDWKISFAIPTSLLKDISESNYSLSYSYTGDDGAKVSGSSAKLSFNK